MPLYTTQSEGLLHKGTVSQLPFNKIDSWPHFLPVGQGRLQEIDCCKVKNVASAFEQ